MKKHTNHFDAAAADEDDFVDLTKRQLVLLILLLLHLRTYCKLSCTFAVHPGTTTTKTFKYSGGYLPNISTERNEIDVDRVRSGWHWAKKSGYLDNIILSHKRRGMSRRERYCAIHPKRLWFVTFATLLYCLTSRRASSPRSSWVEDFADLIIIANISIALVTWMVAGDMNGARSSEGGWWQYELDEQEQVQLLLNVKWKRGDRAVL